MLMKRFLVLFLPLGSFPQLLYWTFLAIPLAIVTGSACALFLWSLEEATRLHWANPALLWGLPVAGGIVGLCYHYLGKGSDKGNNLLIDEIHEPGGGVPARMAPLVLIGTVITHLFGGSAGREGTAVQMGGSLAGLLTRLFRLGPGERKLMLMCGIAAGFGAVFGTPLTGAVFAMEVLVLGRIQYEALIPVLVASIIGDATCTQWGIHHTIYHIDVKQPSDLRAAFDIVLLTKVALAAVCFGLAARFFAEITHGVQALFARLVHFAPLRPVLGGFIVIGLVYLVGSRDYLGLGVTSPSPEGVSIVSSFQAGGADAFSWLWKTVFTAVTLGSGFKGGEVTPLFYIGATLGNVLGSLLNEPIGLFAALGFIAVFAGAANTPLACTIMGIELFGSYYGVAFGLACFIAYFSSGHSGIYLAQRIGTPKGSALITGTTLREVRSAESSRHKARAKESTEKTP